MTTTLKQVREVKHEFLDDIVRNGPLNEFVNGVGIGTLEKDYCLKVYLQQALPDSVSAQQIYKGVPVTYEVVGQIKAL